MEGIFRSETILLSESDIEVLNDEYRKRGIFLLKFTILFVPILVILAGTGGRFSSHAPTPREFKRNLIVSSILFSIFVLHSYYNINYQIKKDLKNGTKMRFRTKIEKTTADDKIPKGAKYCNLLLHPTDMIPTLEKVRGLFYYLVKNVFPPRKFTVLIPKEIYPLLKDGEGIIEISTYSKTFLSFQEN